MEQLPSRMTKPMQKTITEKKEGKKEKKKKKIKKGAINSMLEDKRFYINEKK